MEFAAEQLKKYGWKQGQGLGKKKNGISSAVKVALKRDNTGVGYDASSEFTCQWWSTVFDKAISRVSVEDTEDGVVFHSEDTQKDSVALKRRHYDHHRRALLYGRFEKAAKSLEVEKMELQGALQSVEGGDDMLEEVDSSPQTPTVVMNDERLLKACGGRTAHKAARHGLKLSGKLKRIAKQDRELAETQQRGEVGVPLETVEKGESLSNSVEKGKGASNPRKRTHRTRQVEVDLPASQKAKRRKQ